MDTTGVNHFKITLKKIGVNKYIVKNSIIEPEKKRESINPKVVIKHSIPFPISITDRNKNMIGKGALLMHLYQTPCSPCILCAICKKFFSLEDFFYHMNSDEFARNQIGKIDLEKLTIEPFIFKDQTKLTTNQIKIWQEFKIKTKIFNQN